MTNPLRIVVVTGLSGSGKSTAVRALEDGGWFCVDNLPVPLVDRLVELCAQPDSEIRKVALVMDVREGAHLSQLPRVVSGLRARGVPVEVLFLDAIDDTLIRRFSETRRRHPLAADGAVPDGIAAERALLAPMREVADELIDTSELTLHELKARVQARFGASTTPALFVNLVSFGYKHGVPIDADIVLDARFLPNPYFVPALRERTGVDDDVADWIFASEDAREFADRIVGLLEFVVPRHAREGRPHVTVAVGCTGGRHRSVALTRRVGAALQARGVPVRLRDRDVEKRLAR